MAALLVRANGFVYSGHFVLFWLFVTIGTLLVHCWYSLGRPVTIGTPMVIFAVLTVFWLFLTVFDDWYTVGTVLVDQWLFLLFWLSFDCFWLFLTIGTLLVQSW